MKKKPNIVIVGGGAGGLELVTALGKSLGKKRKANIYLVDMSLTHVWKPLLHEIAAGTINTYDEEVNYIAHAHRNYYNFILGEFVNIDRKSQMIDLKLSVLDQETSDGNIQSFHYDILIIAVGSIANNFNTKGADEYCYYLNTLKDAQLFQQFFLKSMLSLQSKAKSDEAKILDSVIIGGGATGVEFATELYFALQTASEYGLNYLNVFDQIKITIIEANERILSALPASISKLTLKKLNRFNIDVLCGERVTGITKEGIFTHTNKFIPAAIKVWSAGIKSSDCLSQLDGLETNRVNQLLVKPTLQTTKDDKIFAIGDCACCPMGINKEFVPARAQAAHQQATMMVRSIKKILQGKQPLNYVYRDYGSLISLSNRYTIGYLMGKTLGNFTFHGFLARFFYLSLHKMHQIKIHSLGYVIVMTIAKILTFRMKPKVKLH